MTNPSKKEALGKGIRSLLQNIDTHLKQTAGALGDKVVAAATGIERISLDLIVTNPKQPRRDFDEVSLQELSQSIKLHDVIQPITVARVNAKKYQLIAGERRLRAFKLA
jgi:ParB family chromosome partitioning protein